MQPSASGPKSERLRKKGKSSLPPKLRGLPAAPLFKKSMGGTESGTPPLKTGAGKEAWPRPEHKKRWSPRKLAKATTAKSGSGSKVEVAAVGSSKDEPPGSPREVRPDISAHVKNRMVAGVQASTKPRRLGRHPASSATLGTSPLGRRLNGSPRPVSPRSGLATASPAGSVPLASSHFQASATDSTSTSPVDARPRTRSWRRAKRGRVAAEAIAIMAVTCALLIYLLPYRTFTNVFKRSALCVSSSCRQHAEFIASLVNTSLDPCDDFEAYACSRWASKFGEATYGTAMMLMVEHLLINEFRQRLEEGKATIQLARQLAMLFDSCVKHRPAEEADKEIPVLKEFMRELKLRWPQPPLPGVEPLGVILNLACNWNIDIWFHAALSFTDNSRNILLQPGTLFSARWAFAQYIFEVKGYVKYWTDFHRTFAPREAMRSQKDLLNIAAMEESIYREFARVENSTLRNPAYVKIESIQGYTPHISTRQWVDALNGNLVGLGQFLASDGITVTDADLLNVFNNLFANYSREQLLDHISWEVVQLLTPLISWDFMVVKYGNQRRAEMRLTNICVTEISKAYRWLITAVLLLPRFDASGRAAVDEKLAKITNIAIAKVSSLSWADNISMEAIADRLRDLKIVLWPPDHFLTDRGLSVTFRSWFDKGFSFIQHYIQSLKRWQHFRKNLTDRSNDDMAPSLEMPFLNYNPVSNVVQMSAATLLPWHRYKGSNAIFYGGVGFSLARKVVTSFDGFTLAFNQGGKLLKSWPSAAWMEASKKKAACLHPAFDTFFPEIPALEIAYSAYLASEMDGVRSLPIAKEWSPDRVFFVTACFTMCNMPSTLSRFRLGCNKAMMNSVAFAKAFDCPAYSKMSSQRKCTYFS